MNYFPGLYQLWKFDGKALKNRKIFFHFKKWYFKTKDNLIYIENDSYNKVLEASNGAKVIEEDYEEGKTEQLWKMGKPNAEGYFTLENCKVPKLLTGTFAQYSLRIEGNFQLDTIKLMISKVRLFF